MVLNQVCIPNFEIPVYRRQSHSAFEMTNFFMDDTERLNFTVFS
jgi:hypothetical protein